MAIGQHETIPIGPGRIGRVVPQLPRPERDRDFSHAHRHALVAGFGLRHGINRENADRVGGGVESGSGRSGVSHAGELRRGRAR